MKILKYFSLFFLLLAVMACKTKTGDETEAAEKKEVFDNLFMQDSVALIRGSHMAILPEEVLKNELGNPTVQTDSLLEFNYNYKFATGPTQTRLYYTFDEFGLFEIQIDMFPETEESAKELMDEATEHLTEKFGDFESMGLLKRWTTVSTSNRLIEITLSNESREEGKPFVSLNYLEPLPNEI